MISLFFLPVSCQWETYFGNIYYPEEYAYSPKQIHTSEPGDYYIYDCVFKHINSAIEFVYFNEKIQLLVESCMFENCFSTQSGGAILFRANSLATILIHKVCANNCYIKNSKYMYLGNFGYVSMFSKTKSIVNLSMSSIIQCHNSNEACFYSFSALRGRQKINCVNSSEHTSFSTPGLNLEEGFNSIIKYSTFSDNNVSIEGIVTLEKGKYNIDATNFVRNSAPTGAAAVLNAKGNVEVRKSSFYQNQMPTIIAVASEFKVSLLECYIQKGKLIGCILKKKLEENEFTFDIKHYATELCPAQNPN